MLAVLFLLVLRFGYSVQINSRVYTVYVTTPSSPWDAGTDASVKIKITGTDGVTPERELDNGNDPFEKGQTDKFTLTEYDKGYVKGMQIRRDNSGTFAGWYLKEVVITVAGAADSVFYYNDWVPKNEWKTLTLSCRAGYSINHDGICADTDRCDGANPCKDQRATCVNTVDSFTCSCPSGYEMPNNADNDICQDKDECAGANPCNDQRATCVNTGGSFTCSCPSGYEMPNNANNGMCQDIDECAGSNNCDVRKSTCDNIDGDYQCTCNSGYKNDSPQICVDANECSDGSHTCNATTSTCLNDEGGYACQCKDGFYQGSTNKICLANKCAALNTPFASTLDPSRCIQANVNNFGYKCTMVCNPGYVISNVAYGTVTCGAGGKWEGNFGICNPVKCPQLTADPNGGLYPSTCATDGGNYPEACAYTCNSGYMVIGQSSRNCQTDGTWAGSPPTCTITLVAPWIRCPSNIVRDLPTGKSTADVSDVWEEPTSNVQSITVQPAEISAAYQFPVGTTNVEWTASNSVGSESCSINVLIKDAEAPTVESCPSDIYEERDTTSAITWVVPTFKDNVAVTSIDKSHSSGDMFELGTTNVKYDAKDAAGNRNSCEFKVTLKRKPCADPSPPADGASTCQEFGGTSFCTVTCNSGMQLYKGTASFWQCNSGIWTPSALIPDCVEATTKLDDVPCEEGRIAMNVTRFQGPELFCAKCPMGMYALHGDCSLCPIGTYSDQQGQTVCTDCPSGTSSEKGAKSSTDCLQPCPAGRYSSNGLGPNCQICPGDTYQDQLQQTSCVPCPNGTYTVAMGHATPESCGVKPMITSIQPSFANIKEGESVMFTCYASGTPTPSYKWQFSLDIPPAHLGQMSQAPITDSDGKEIGAKFTITGATKENTGSYECIVTNTHGQDLQYARINVEAVFDVDAGSGA